MMETKDRRLQPGEGSKAKRVFWLGAHKVLKPTELRNLRELGFEVFNPPYVTKVYDQSQDLRVDLDQPTTLPPDVFRELMAHRFFYNEVPPRIAELLNEYFDIAIVTINSDWLRSFLRVFRGALIYRLYGQHFRLSDELVERGIWELMVERDDVSIVPFARESVEREHAWFLDRCVAFVPYQIPDDVFALSGTWSGHPAHPEIATNIPNIQNPYYAAAYAEFAARFQQRVFRIYGPQRTHPADPRIVGSLERADFLARLAAASGYFYDYVDDVCYLPPIEMMEIGGPVIYRDGSLLSRFYGERTPGLMRDDFDAETKIRRLAAGDHGFVSEVLAAQETVRRRYDRAIVRPLFDEAFSALLHLGPSRTPTLRYADRVLSLTSRGHDAEAGAPTSAVLLHAEGWFSHGPAGGVMSRSRPAELARRVVETLARHTDERVLVTCGADQVAVFQDLFLEDVKSGRVHLRAVPTGIDVDEPLERLLAIEAVNGSPRIGTVLVPSLTAFPEALLLTGRITLLVADGTVLYGRPEEADPGEPPGRDAQVAAALIAKADRLIVTSTFAASAFMAQTRDGSAGPPVVRVLTEGKSPVDGLRGLDGRVAAQLAGRRFVLFEAEGCSDEQLDVAVRVFALARLIHPSLRLVCLRGPGQAARLREAAETHRVPLRLLTLCVADCQLRGWLLETAACVWIGETRDGRSAARAVDAVWAETPVVAVQTEEIEREFGALARKLALCAPSDFEEAAAQLGAALSDSAGLRERQRAAREMLAREAGVDCLLSALGDRLAPSLAHAKAPPP